MISNEQCAGAYKLAALCLHISGRTKELTESRRTRYTRRAMQDALIELLRNQPLGSITVKRCASGPM